MYRQPLYVIPVLTNGQYTLMIASNSNPRYHTLERYNQQNFTLNRMIISNATLFEVTMFRK